MSVRGLFPVLSLGAGLLAACSGPGGADPTDTESDVPAAISIDFLDGQDTNTLPDGSPAGSARVLLRRTLDPDAATLEEVVHTEGAEGPTTWTLTGEVDAEAGTWAFAFADDYGRIEGTGAFTAGEPWAWTAWESTSTYVSGPYTGMTVRSTDTLGEDGLRADKEIRDADGALQISVAEALSRVDEGAWQAAVDAFHGR